MDIYWEFHLFSMLIFFFLWGGGCCLETKSLICPMQYCRSVDIIHAWPQKKMFATVFLIQLWNTFIAMAILSTYNLNFFSTHSSAFIYLQTLFTNSEPITRVFLHCLSNPHLNSTSFHLHRMQPLTVLQNKQEQYCYAFNIRDNEYWLEEHRGALDDKKNWRPYVLHNTDFKIKSISNTVLKKCAG